MSDISLIDALFVVLQQRQELRNQIQAVLDENTRLKNELDKLRRERLERELKKDIGYDDEDDPLRDRY